MNIDNFLFVISWCFMNWRYRVNLGQKNCTYKVDEIYLFLLVIFTSYFELYIVEKLYIRNKCVLVSSIFYFFIFHVIFWVQTVLISPKSYTALILFIRMLFNRILFIRILLHFIHTISNNAGIVIRFPETFSKVRIQINVN